MTTEEFNTNYRQRSSLDGNFIPCGKAANNEKKPKVKKVVSNSGSIKKKTLKDKFMDTFITEDINTVKENILSNIISGIKSFALDSMEMLLFGDYGSRSTRRYGSGGIVRNYNAISASRSRLSPTPASRTPVKRPTQVEEIALDSRADCADVIDALAEAIDQYGEVNIADFYESAGMTSLIEHTDYNYGWHNLDGYRVDKYFDHDEQMYKYVIRMPKPVVLDR